MTGNRKAWLDSLRALAMMFVVFGHQAFWCTTFFVITSPVKMPIFFAISGYLFKSYDVSFVVKLKHLLFRIGIPWVVLGLGPIIVASIWRGDLIRIGSYVLDMISGKVLWFMPCFLISEIVFFLNLKVSKQTNWWLVGLCITECALGVILGIHHIADYAMINRALAAQLFMVTGYMIKQYEYIINRLHPILLVIVLLCGISFCFFEYNATGMLVDIHKSQYPLPMMDMLVIVIECISVFYIFGHFKVEDKISAFVGRNTLLIFILAPYFSTAIRMFFALFHKNISNQYLKAIIITALVLLAGSLLSEFFARFAPWVIGLRKRK